MTSGDFETFWRELITWLSDRQDIRNWTVLHKETGEDFEAEYGGKNYVLAYPEAPAKTQRIPREDFKVIFENWEGYLNQKIGRSEFVHGPIAFSRFTKYAISIIHEFKSQKEKDTHY